MKVLATARPGSEESASVACSMRDGANFHRRPLRRVRALAAGGSRWAAAIAVAALSWGCRGEDVTVTGAVGRGVEPTPYAPSSDASARANRPGEFASPAAGDGASDLAEQLELACGAGLLTNAGRDQIARRPYIQNVSSTSAAILFTTREPRTEATLRVTEPAGVTRDVATELDAADATGRQRRALLRGLRPATVYCYQLLDWTEPVGFRTAPAPGTSAGVRFIAFGDSGGESRELVRHEMDAVSFDLMLHVGDIAYMRGTLSEFESTFFDTYAGLIAHFPIFAASGNHEHYTSDAAPYREVFELPDNGAPYGTERWFSFDWGDIHFVALDTERVGAEQAEWLERDLSLTSLGWKIVYMHKPPFSSGAHGSSLDVREAFSPLFERFGVQLVLAGHDHDYERTLPIGGVTYIVTGGGGFGLRVVGTSDFTAHSEATFHIVYGELQGNTLWLRALGTSGEVIDSTRIARDRGLEEPR